MIVTACGHAELKANVLLNYNGEFEKKKKRFKELHHEKGTSTMIHPG